MNNYKARAYLCSLLILFIGLYGLNGQDYIIQNDGTQLQGEVKQQSNYLDEVGFRIDKKNNFKIYKPEEINGFYKDGNMYHSLIDEDSNVHGFYQLLVSGTIKFYDGPYSENSITYYVKKNETVYELNQTITIVDNKIIKKPNYLVPLKQLTLDQIELFNKVDKLEFRRNELIKFFQSYNKASGNYENNALFTNSISNSKFSVNLNYHSAGLTRIKNPLFGQINYGVGLNYHLFIKYNFQFSIGAKFSIVNSDIDKELRPGNVINATAIQLPIEINYLMGNKAIKPKLKFGIGYTKLLKKDLVDMILTTTGQMERVRDLGVSSGVTISLGTGININNKMYCDLIFSNTLFEIGGSSRIDTFWRTLTFSAGYYLN